jgi:hypothetical protein
MEHPHPRGAGAGQRGVDRLQTRPGRAGHADLDVEIGLPADRDLDLDLHRGQRAVGVTGQRHPSRGQVGPGVGDPDLRRIGEEGGRQRDREVHDLIAADAGGRHQVDLERRIDGIGVGAGRALGAAAGEDRQGGGEEGDAHRPDGRTTGAAGKGRVPPITVAIE